jgi:hypothetical protein
MQQGPHCWSTLPGNQKDEIAQAVSIAGAYANSPHATLQKSILIQKQRMTNAERFQNHSPRRILITNTSPLSKLWYARQCFSNARTGLNQKIEMHTPSSTSNAGVRAPPFCTSMQRWIEYLRQLRSPVTPHCYPFPFTAEACAAIQRKRAPKPDWHNRSSTSFHGISWASR